MQDEDRLIQGPTISSSWQMNSPSPGRQDSEGSTGPGNPGVCDAGRHTKQIQKGMTNFAIQADGQMEMLEVL